MAFKLYLGFTFFLIFGHCFVSSCPFLEEAKEITEQETAEYEHLHELYNIPFSDFQFSVEMFGPSQQNKQAHVLTNYQKLLKNNSTQCIGRTFPDCVREHTGEVPKEERCQVVVNSCDINEKYSRPSGHCNNLNSPNMGKSNTAYSRWLDPAYSDGINEFRKTKSNKELPNPREMGNKLQGAKTFTNDPAKDSAGVNNFAALMFGLMVGHDNSARKLYEVVGKMNKVIRCCNDEKTGPLPLDQINPNCIPVSLPKDDPFYSLIGVFCQNYLRMETTLQNDCTIVNGPESVMSHILDLSTIYSSSEEQLKPLRANHSGLFQMDSDSLFPVDARGGATTADPRFKLSTLLAMMYSLYMQFHNVVATNLQAANPNWTNDQTFFESRRLVIAIYQHIIYCEWLPLVMDEDVLKSRGLSCKEISFFSSEYDETVDPSTMTDYMKNALKFFHVNIPTTIYLADESYQTTGELRVSDTYFKIDTLPGNFDSYLRGSIKTPQRINLPGYTDEFRNLFMKRQFRGQEVGVDGFIVDMMRSRDAGTPPLVAYFGPCFGTQINSYDDLGPYFEPEHLELLKSFYEDVSDIDLLAAIVLEKRSHKHFIGKIGGCIIAEQFHRYKAGDRFFYTHSNTPNAFSSGQLAEIKKMTFSQIICMTRSFKEVPLQGFVTISEKNPLVTCDDTKYPNFLIK